jgi:MarR family transcriptional regulator, lower aerobic nicotinate degradation pathway regulator
LLLYKQQTTFLIGQKRMADTDTPVRPDQEYVLDDQIGYKMRLANQRHLEIFSHEMPDLTPTQFSILARLYQVGEVSQNHLGRLVTMDAATTKGVIDRLTRKGLVRATPSKTDRRRLQISLTTKGMTHTQEAIRQAGKITDLTLSNLSATERKRLLELLGKMGA